MIDLSKIEQMIEDQEMLTEEQQIEIYGYKALGGIPAAMSPWNMGFHQSEYSRKYGRYALVDVSQASLETHHEVYVIDENGSPLRNVWVVFGFSTGEKRPRVQPQEFAWSNRPDPLGNPQLTDGMGYARHTYQQGGENIFLWPVEEGVLLPSPMVTNCTWVGTGEGADFIHTGVQLTFQRRKTGLVPQRLYQARLEGRVLALESAQAQLAESAELKGSIEQLADRIQRAEDDIAFIKNMLAKL